MSTLTMQQVKAYWRIIEDFPTKDGEYVVCFQKDNGDFGWPEIWEYTARNGWNAVFGEEHSQPSHWCELPMPR